MKKPTNPLDRFLSTLSLVSRIPVKLRFSPDHSRTDFYLPLTGIFPAFLGALVFFLGFLYIRDRSVTVFLILQFQYLGFNLFHLDGLMDTADAFLAAGGREKRAAILKDSRIGVYGFFAGIACLAFKFILLYRLSVVVSQFPAFILAYPITGRFAAALVPAISRPFREDGLGFMVKDSKIVPAAAGTVLAAGIWAAMVFGLLYLYGTVSGSNLFSPFPGAGNCFPGVILSALPVLGCVSAVLIAGLYRKKLGGYTGDALGAGVELGEILHLGAAWIVLRAWGFFLVG
ncbi:adenosylcobinamide-GDP ribazoletransferase [Breznakiella homolactica]|uniref:Adenosylcobinamide-GDP ribazoletransferase n=1 Tax=Breznakiella homolactica TaxID=2798577 RepID=A0A7T7XJM8_9SPIR|nr:adenosylcobinamide-GDP ribazoletransferase [Breznakiella homolactica]QQO07478.1 adenosylcobinamide-GDP ribazoletransferase [Breznakiella homolactica]